MVARLDSFEYFHVVAHVVPDLDKFLARHGAFAAVLGDKREILPVDAGYVQKRNCRAFAAAPRHLHARLLRNSQLRLRIGYCCLGQNCLRFRIDLRRHKRDRRICEQFTHLIQQFHRQPYFQGARAIHWNVNVRFERARLIHCRQQRGYPNTVTHMDWNVSDNPVHRRAHTVIVQLDFLRVDLFFQRFQLRHRGIVIRLSRIVLRLADHACF